MTFLVVLVNVVKLTVVVLVVIEVKSNFLWNPKTGIHAAIESFHQEKKMTAISYVW